jgi:hypothetical protein
MFHKFSSLHKHTKLWSPSRWCLTLHLVLDEIEWNWAQAHTWRTSNLIFKKKIKNVRTRIGGFLLKKEGFHNTGGSTPSKKIKIKENLNPLPHPKEKDGPSWVHDKPPHWLHGNSIPKTVCCNFSPELIGVVPPPPPPLSFQRIPFDTYGYQTCEPNQK